MADPLSTLASAITVGDVCIRVSRYLRELAAATKQMPASINSLEQEILKFHGIYGALQQICASAAVQKTIEKAGQLQDSCMRLLELAAGIVCDAQRVLDDLEEKILRVIEKGANRSWGKIRDIQMAISFVQAQKGFTSSLSSLESLNVQFELMFTSINL